ncbi:soyasapogenol B glucuronide galactosyltransferase [Ziziphus jujuba]|uniref:Soyasapogenol B glucuronide galactosyltransferase n=1 Tax=Ziziphus jujuba TaxID=326968 RepID=A0ABM3IPR6_ZIZJJ|nr:soyasapogenol B glucuronide galactosyltransferase [Ziziphus jujuba]
MRPDCIVSDMFFPWTLDLADELGIPRLAFRGTSYFSLCAEHCVRTYQPHKNSINSDAVDIVSLPGLPHKIEMLISQLPDWLRTTTHFTHLMEPITEAEEKSYGILMNSFHELEKAYEEHFPTTIGLKSWSLGPVSLWANQDLSEKTERCKISGSEDRLEVIDWLNSKPQNSVLYVSFGGLTKLPANQLNEIANGLESSGHTFIWVVRKKENDEYEQAFPKGFEERMKESGNGFIIKGWAPQMVILDHPAIGGMVTHCGWNSMLEGLNSRLPMITWPMFAEQFFNEKLLVDVLRIGVAVGVKEWRDWGNEGGGLVVKREEVEKAVRLLMGGGEEAVDMRKRVSKLQDEAKKAVEIGGSSYSSLLALIDELKTLKKLKN